MITFFHTLLRGGLPLQLFIAILLFGWRLEKRHGFALGVVGIGFLMLAGQALAFQGLLVTVPAIAQSDLAIRILYSLLAYLFGFFSTWGLYRITPKEAAFCCTAAYLTQHFAYCLTALFTPQSSNDRFFAGDPLCWLLFLGSYGAFYLLFARKLPEKGHYQADVSSTIGTTLSALTLSLVLSAVAQVASTASVLLYNVCLLYAMTCCFYLLWDQTGRKRQLDMQRDLSLQEQAFRKYQEQYEMSQETVELINRKCHDLKHQIAALKLVTDPQQRNATIEELERDVMIYDSFVKTGNSILDTLLTEKSLSCEAEGIQLACVADGACLAGMAPVDIYALFGNALDNAIESVRKLPDPAQKQISLSLIQKAGLAILQIENCYEGELKLEDGLPLTTKQSETGWHGFGMRSMRATAEKYGGVLDIRTEHGVFLMRVTLPLQP